MILPEGPIGWEDMRLTGAPVDGAHYLLVDFTHDKPSFLLTALEQEPFPRHRHQRRYLFWLLDNGSFRVGPKDPRSPGDRILRRIVLPVSASDLSPQERGVHGAPLRVLCRCTVSGTPLEPDGSPWAGVLLPPQPPVS